jgi:SOS-response transcriptional repressor LexA
MPTRNKPQPSDYVVAKNGEEEATFKQLVRDGADLYLKPINERYPIKPLGKDKIVGVVREMIQKFR